MNLGNIMYITWRKVGVVFDKIEESENKESMTWYISVPLHSDTDRMVDGSELAGDVLAKRVKECAIDAGMKRLTVKYRIRNETWTEDMAKAAEISARKELYGSQY